jgi:hypothetical protein
MTRAPIDTSRKNEATGTTITYITDPWGTRIELMQRCQ